MGGYRKNGRQRIKYKGEKVKRGCEEGSESNRKNFNERRKTKGGRKEETKEQGLKMCWDGSEATQADLHSF